MLDGELPDEFYQKALFGEEENEEEKDKKPLSDREITDFERYYETEAETDNEEEIKGPPPIGNIAENKWNSMPPDDATADQIVMWAKLLKYSLPRPISPIHDVEMPPPPVPPLKQPMKTDVHCKTSLPIKKKRKGKGAIAKRMVKWQQSLSNNQTQEKSFWR